MKRPEYWLAAVLVIVAAYNAFNIDCSPGAAWWRQGIHSWCALRADAEKDRRPAIPAPAPAPSNSHPGESLEE